MVEHPAHAQAAIHPGTALAEGSCPVPHAESGHILLGHGSGGRLQEELLASLVLPSLAAGRAARDRAAPLEDAALIAWPGLECHGEAPDLRHELAFSTDSFVVNPLFFPGGDIGALAVHGTINDLAMRGATPVALALAAIIEEGLPFATLEAVLTSAGRAASAAGVDVVTGDTKVVERGAADRLFLTTTGIGRRLPGLRPSAAAARPGDAVLLSGPIGLHGVTVLSARGNLGFAADIASDTRPLHRLVQALAALGPDVHTLRDPTRGGVAAALGEIARDSCVGITVDEPALPVPDPVAAACDLLGLDPLHVANEGCMLAMVARGRADEALDLLRALPEGAQAVRIGTVTDDRPGRVVLRTGLGGTRPLEMPIGEQLPRIC
ncbi:MAG: hydrogenase expression/formation protein HypE [Streptomycetaceae bacterium]|nr:hydrogenase expression/formation protein HypE [Streptomycetaceae bacterium]